VKIATKAAGIAVALTLLLSGCSADTLGKDAKDNYTSADGAVLTVAKADRGAAIDFSGKADDGTTISRGDFDGTVLVVNFWYAACAPCRTEAPRLESVYSALKSDGVDFVGVNTFDQADTSKAFARNHKISYPSILDVDSGRVRLAFAGKFAPNATPTTIVLDQKGRVAARIRGEIDSSAILTQLVSDVLAEAK
jgi:peroxiredoxin